MNKITFLLSDGANVNFGKESGLIAVLQEKRLWVVFIWCFSHRLELALKDALKQEFDPINETLKNMYYLYETSRKKLRELKKLYQLLKDEYKMYGASIKP